MFKSCKYDLFGRLLDLAGQEDFVEDSIDLRLHQHSKPVSYPLYPYLIKVEHQIQLTNIPKELIQHLDKEVYGLQVCQFIIIRVNARTEEEAGIATVDDLAAAAELDEVRLVLLVARSDKAVDLAFELDLFFVRVGVVPFC